MLTGGTRLGVYEVTTQIGGDGMGEVYCATDTCKRWVGGYHSAARLGGQRCGSPFIEFAAKSRQ